MDKLKQNVKMRAVKCLAVVLETLPIVAVWYLWYADRIISPFYNKGNWVVIAVFVSVYFLCARVYEAFRIELSRISDLIYSQILAALIADGIFYMVTWLLSKYLPAVWPLLLALAAQGLLAYVWCRGAHKWYFHTFAPERTAVIYDSRRGLEELIGQYGLQDRFCVVKTMPLQEALADCGKAVENVEAVFLCGISSHERNTILKKCVAENIAVYVLPRIGDVIMSGAKPMHLFHLPVLQVERYDPQPEFLLVKRLFDIVCSGAALLVLSPVMIVLALVIHFYDGGPALYAQCRLTKDGKKFMLHKFRSMRVDAEKDGVARLSTGENDSRITPVGRVIRACRLDELPQLLDILRGDMSIVGPRPERPEIAAQYEEELPEFSLRLQAKAGLTGYAQVYGKYNTTPYDKLQMDLMYIAKPSLFEDLRIIFATVKILFVKESTEGVAEGQTTAQKEEEKAGVGTGN